VQGKVGSERLAVGLPLSMVCGRIAKEDVERVAANIRVNYLHTLDCTLQRKDFPMAKGAASMFQTV